MAWLKCLIIKSMAEIFLIKFLFRMTKCTHIISCFNASNSALAASQHYEIPTPVLSQLTTQHFTNK